MVTSVPIEEGVLRTRVGMDVGFAVACAPVRLVEVSTQVSPPQGTRTLLASDWCIVVQFTY